MGQERAVCVADDCWHPGVLCAHPPSLACQFIPSSKRTPAKCITVCLLHPTLVHFTRSAGEAKDVEHVKQRAMEFVETSAR